MSEILNQISNLQSIEFEDAKNAAAWAGMAILPATVAVFGVDYFRNTHSKEAGLKGADIESLQEVNQIKQGRLTSRLSKWGTPLLLAGGASVLAINGLNPTVEYEETIPETESMFIIDSSDSMYYTNDMSENDRNRLDASVAIYNNSLENAPNDMRIGVVAFGESVDQILPLSAERTELETGLVSEEVEDRGSGQLEDVLDVSEAVLSGNNNAGSDSLVIFTDGTIDDTNQATAKIREISENGTNVFLALTGTEDATYTRSEFDTREYGSGVSSVQFESLNELDNVTVLSSSNTGEITEAVTDFIDDTTTTTERRPTEIFYYLAAGLGASALVRSIYRKFNRK